MGESFKNRESEQEEYTPFEEASENEQIERFQNLRALYRSDEFGEYSDEKERGDFYDFYQNIYKYPERFDIEGLDRKQTAEVFEQARLGNEVIKSTLEYFPALKRRETGVPEQHGDMPPEVFFGEVSRVIPEAGQFIDRERGRLDTEKLVEMFKWSLDTFQRGGEKIGRRVPEMSAEERKQMSDDLRSVLEAVNEDLEKGSST